MLLWLTDILQNYLHGFAVFQYITLRAILSTITSLLITLLLGPKIISLLTKAQIGQVVRTDGPKSHLSKSGTPTMGGVLILTAITITVLLWGNLTNIYLWVVLGVMVSYGLIGWIDDYKKLILKFIKY